MNRPKQAQQSIGDALTLLIDESTMKTDGLQDRASFSIPTLTFLSGEALGKEMPLLQPQVTLGRGKECDLVLMDPAISRTHVRITSRKLIRKGKGQYLRIVLQDLDSKNGTLVNHRRVRRVTLKPGDKITLGQTILKFEFRDFADQNFHEAIYRLATTDGLTGLLNKTTITRALSEEILKQQRYHRRLSVLLLDLDDFKSLNDTLGHLTGDRVLQTVAEILTRNLRCQDKAGRFGGEEFLVVLPETGLRGAATSAERIRRDLERSIAAKVGLERAVTASIGVASFPVDGAEADDLLDRADAALYRAKARGKNRVELQHRTSGLSGLSQSSKLPCSEGK
jgi:diguanylate cyclase (GGDEF)-like protein